MTTTISKTEAAKDKPRLYMEVTKMLVLKRHLYEKIIITLPDGRLVEIFPVEIGLNKCRIGINAPPDVPVNRQEVHEAIQAKE